MGNERPDHSENAPLPFGVRYFRPADQRDRTRYKVLSLNHFSEAAIRELLRQMYVGYNPGKAIAFAPLNSTAEESEAITAEELYHLRDWIEDEDVTEELDSRAKRIKQSRTIVMIQKYQV